MADYEYWDAIECPKDKFEEKVDNILKGWRLLSEDYQLGATDIDGVGQYLGFIRKHVYDALGPYRLGRGKVKPQIRYRCDSKETFESLLVDHTAWKLGKPLAERPEPEWLLAYAGDQDGEPTFEPASSEQKVRLFQLCDACAFSVRRFAHAFDGVEVPMISGHAYGRGDLYCIPDAFPDDGGFLHDPDPIRKTYRVCSSEGTKCEFRVYGADEFRNPGCKFYKAKGYITGYVDTDKDVVGEIWLFGHGTDRLEVSFYRHINQDQPQEFLPWTHERWRPYWEERARLDQWVEEDEKALLARQLHAFGFGGEGAHIVDCVYSQPAL